MNSIRGPGSYVGLSGLPTPDDALWWKSRAQSLEAAVSRLQEQSLGVGAVVGKSNGKLLVRGNGLISVKAPVGIDVKVGDCVYLTQEGGIVARIDDPARFGQALKVRALDGESGIELELQTGGSGYALTSRPVKVGDRVLLDPSGSVVTHVLSGGASEMVYAEPTNVSWDDIGGQVEAKRALIETVEEPHKYKELYAKYGKAPAKGILLYGPPGNGKTMLAKAVSTSLATTHGQSARAGGFIYVKGPELLNMFVGKSEAGVRNLFVAARDFWKQNGYPAVICIDEADALLGKRGANINEGMERTIVPQFLAEMDGLDPTGAVVMLLTNRPEALDPACVRDGRVDRKVKVARPLKEDALLIVYAAIGDKPGEGRTRLAQCAIDELWSGKHSVAMVRMKKGGIDRRLGLDSFVSGAMLVGIVEKATQLAIRRDIASGGEPSGIGSDDILAAVKQARVELEGLDHTAVVLEAVGKDAADVVKVEPIGVM